MFYRTTPAPTRILKLPMNNSFEDFDLMDRRILFELDQNSRQSYAELGRKVRLGSDLVRYRVEKLLSLGVVHNCSTLIDVHRLGVTLYKIYLKLDQSRAEEVLSYLDNEKCTYWLASLYGTWDAVYNVAAFNIRELHELLRRTFNRFPGAILNYTVCTIVERTRYPKKYLVPKASTIGSTVGGIRESQEIDELENSLLWLLAKDSRMSSAELARRLDSTPAIVDYRIKKLEKSGIIQRYWVQLDYEKLKLIFLKIAIHPKDFTLAQEKRFQEFCRRSPYITCHIIQVGEIPLECEAEVPSLSVLHELLKEMRTEFSEFIGSVDHMIVSSDRYHRVPSSFKELRGRPGS